MIERISTCYMFGPTTWKQARLGSHPVDESWEQHLSAIEKRYDAVPCLAIIVTVGKLGMARQIDHEDTTLMNDGELDIGGMIVKVWT